MNDGSYWLELTLKLSLHKGKKKKKNQTTTTTNLFVQETEGIL